MTLYVYHFHPVLLLKNIISSQQLLNQQGHAPPFTYINPNPGRNVDTIGIPLFHCRYDIGRNVGTVGIPLFYSTIKVFQMLGGNYGSVYTRPRD